MKKFFQEFKAFIAKGNVVDMAVAVIIGGAFSKIVTALVNDIIMPLVSLVTGGVSVADWKWVITPAVVENGVEVHAEAALRYGDFLQTILDFLIISLCIFAALKVLLALQTRTRALLHKKAEEEEKEAEAAPPVETEADVLRDIRELLRAQQASKIEE